MTFVIGGIIGIASSFIYALIIGTLASLVSMAGLSEFMPEELGLVAGTTAILGAVAWIGLTLASAVAGAIYVAIGAWLYNRLAGLIGGVSLTLDVAEAAVDSGPSTSAMPDTANSAVKPIGADKATQ